MIPSHSDGASASKNCSGTVTSQDTIGNNYSRSSLVGVFPHITPELYKLWPSEIFRNTTSKNELLQDKVDELERELSVWKTAFKAAEDEQRLLRMTIKKLGRNIGSSTVRSYLNFNDDILIGITRMTTHSFCA